MFSRKLCRGNSPLFTRIYVGIISRIDFRICDSNTAGSGYGIHYSDCAHQRQTHGNQCRHWGRSGRYDILLGNFVRLIGYTSLDGLCFRRLSDSRHFCQVLDGRSNPCLCCGSTERKSASEIANTTSSGGQSAQLKALHHRLCHRTEQRIQPDFSSCISCDTHINHSSNSPSAYVVARQMDVRVWLWRGYLWLATHLDIACVTVSHFGFSERFITHTTGERYRHHRFCSVSWLGNYQLTFIVDSQYTINHLTFVHLLSKHE